MGRGKTVEIYLHCLSYRRDDGCLGQFGQRLGKYINSYMWAKGLFHFVLNVGNENEIKIKDNFRDFCPQPQKE